MKSPLATNADPFGDLARTLALRTSRRGFFRNVLRGAAVVGASSAFVGKFWVDPAYALNCGPSPYCPSGGCNGLNKVCGSGCVNATYGHTSCGGVSPGCWLTPGNRLCCDCCCPNATGATCTGSGCNSWKKCICEFPCC